MKDELKSDASLIISYMTLRKIIGLLGITLPFILSLGAVAIFRTGIQSSISSYYHTGMRDVFVGILCVIGFFLLSYKGWDKDRIFGRLGCLFAVGLALFPTRPDGLVSGGAIVIGYLHLAFAALFFLTLIYFSLRLFTQTDETRMPTTRKKYRNRIYIACGLIMSACILLIVVYSVLPDTAASQFEAYRPVFWLEAVAILAFGLSWITKGEAILKDKVPAQHEPV